MKLKLSYLLALVVVLGAAAHSADAQAAQNPSAPASVGATGNVNVVGSTDPSSAVIKPPTASTDPTTQQGTQPKPAVTSSAVEDPTKQQQQQPNQQQQQPNQQQQQPNQQGVVPPSQVVPPTSGQQQQQQNPSAPTAGQGQQQPSKPQGDSETEPKRRREELGKCKSRCGDACRVQCIDTCEDRCETRYTQQYLRSSPSGCNSCSAPCARQIPEVRAACALADDAAAIEEPMFSRGDEDAAALDEDAMEDDAAAEPSFQAFSRDDEVNEEDTAASEEDALNDNGADEAEFALADDGAGESEGFWREDEFMVGDDADFSWLDNIDGDWAVEEDA